MTLLIVLAVLAYAGCSLGTGYLCGLARIDSPEVPVSFLAILLGPVGLVLCAAYLLEERGKQRRELWQVQHRVALAAARREEEEVERLLRGDA